MKTVSYKLAKKLKELGFKGKTTHYWIKPVGYEARVKKGKGLGFVEGDFSPYKEQRPKRYKAPTLDEMIKALPVTISWGDFYARLVIDVYDRTVAYTYKYNNCRAYFTLIVNGDVTNACAKLWILLKEKGLV